MTERIISVDITHLVMDALHRRPELLDSSADQAHDEAGDVETSVPA